MQRFVYRRNGVIGMRSEEHTSELQSLRHLVCRLLLEKKKKKKDKHNTVIRTKTTKNVSTSQPSTHSCVRRVLLCSCLFSPLLAVFFSFFFFFNDTATTEIYTLSLHDALPIWVKVLVVRAVGWLSVSFVI